MTPGEYRLVLTDHNEKEVAVLHIMATGPDGSLHVTANDGTSEDVTPETLGQRIGRWIDFFNPWLDY